MCLSVTICHFAELIIALFDLIFAVQYVLCSVWCAVCAVHCYCQACLMQEESVSPAPCAGLVATCVSDHTLPGFSSPSLLSDSQLPLCWHQWSLWSPWCAPPPGQTPRSPPAWCWRRTTLSAPAPTRCHTLLWTRPCAPPADTSTSHSLTRHVPDVRRSSNPERRGEKIHVIMCVDCATTMTVMCDMWCEPFSWPKYEQRRPT